MKNAAPTAHSARWQASHISEARNRVGLPQTDFAELLGVSVRTLQDWEQGRRTPSGAAKTLLQVAMLHPETLRELPPWRADEHAES
ncbi:helix-turn-helix domain-containing protein [Achromobacter denitrificans]|jgi:putative transcriptional regulator|uniref:Helix-turn-helix domain-containing protein n=1 Tax=Achromobacter denitrificans TaxID=32002 RepID=A0A3R9G606_ACHDE|nr:MULTISPECIES: helix-turn-helix domain-containing protein [Achromobacter]MPT23535.1 helix-turn-helix domain-containing protein [Starkeya sp.]ASC65041.1 transcriptional regulator [Achromobacter denitrificans]MBV2160093.1 helix-turn-helix domain-containing protein [Achromobacter denitrificans]MDF3847872.1 helix-turn-helix domain-containing protein [Achromobacter denitrificans]MDF3860637.1 helix-turn-helix domain-containing protein [Achromobacter denitrificans]